MSSDVKASFLDRLKARYGSVRKLDRSQSLFVLGREAARVYVRYSKVHQGNRTFYGLRTDDLRRLEGHPSVICFLWDGQTEPLFLRFAEYEEDFRSTQAASDGQFKVQLYLQDESTELYVAQAGRFNVEGAFGWDELDACLDSARVEAIPEFTHPQMQTLLGSIGIIKGYDVWVPSCDRGRLDWSVTDSFLCREVLSFGFYEVERVAREIDVIWMHRGSSEPRALFEVEHSTPIYSGLLRFNDVHLVAPRLRPRFSIVANDTRRDVFARQLNRPTFRTSGLSELCTFLDYKDVYRWHNRLGTSQIIRPTPFMSGD